MKYNLLLIVCLFTLNNILAQTSSFYFYNSSDREKINFYTLLLYNYGKPLKYLPDSNGKVVLEKNLINNSDSILLLLNFQNRIRIKKEKFSQEKIYLDNTTSLEQIVLNVRKIEEYGIDRSNFVPSELRPNNRIGTFFPVEHTNKNLIGIKIKIKKGFIPYTNITRAKREKGGLRIQLYSLRNDTLVELKKINFYLEGKFSKWLTIPIEELNLRDLDNIIVKVNPISKPIFVKTVRKKESDSIRNVMIIGKKPKIWNKYSSDNILKIKLILK